MVRAPSGSSTRLGRLRRLLGDDRAWLAAALIANLLIGWSADGASPLAWLNPILFVVALLVRWHDVRAGPSRLPLHGPAAVAGFLLVGWTFGMVVELTLSSSPGQYGGMHPQTGPSFLLAQGFYLPVIAATWLAVRWYGLDVRRAFFFGAAVAWWEVLTVGAVALISPLFAFAPFLIAYYASTYALICMGGLLVVDPQRLWAPDPRAISDRRLVVYGLVVGAGGWAVFVAWAQVASRLFDFTLA